MFVNKYYQLGSDQRICQTCGCLDWLHRSVPVRGNVRACKRLVYPKKQIGCEMIARHYGNCAISPRPAMMRSKSRRD